MAGSSKIYDIARLREVVVEEANKIDLDISDKFLIEEAFQNVTDIIFFNIYRYEDFNDKKEYYISQKRNIESDVLEIFSKRIAENVLKSARNEFNNKMSNIRNYYGFERHTIKIDGMEW